MNCHPEEEAFEDSDVRINRSVFDQAPRANRRTTARLPSVSLGRCSRSPLQLAQHDICYLLLRSPCTLCGISSRLDRRRLGKTQTSLLLLSACTIFDPMKTIPIQPGIALRELQTDDAADIFAAIDGQRAYLGRWLPFVQFTRTEEDSLRFVRSVLEALPRSGLHNPRRGAFHRAYRLQVDRSVHPRHRDRLLALRSMAGAGNRHDSRRGALPHGPRGAGDAQRGDQMCDG